MVLYLLITLKCCSKDKLSLPRALSLDREKGTAKVFIFSEALAYTLELRERGAKRLF